MSPILGIIASQNYSRVAPDNGAMFPIAMANVGNGGTSTITFSNIPQTYKHLQIRLSYNNLTGLDNLQMRLNPSTSSVNASYWHLLYGNGTSAVADASNVSSSSVVGIQFGRSDTIQYSAILDLSDYTSTTKNKVLKFLGGVDNNGSGGVWLTSNIYQTTTAVTSLSFKFNTYNFTPGTVIGLYGIKG